MAETAVKSGPKTGSNRSAETRFKPGNPGRPKGSRNRRTLLAERIMSEDLEAVARAVVMAARSGDMVAARLVLDRLAPTRRGRPVQFDMPMGSDAAALAQGFDALLQVVAAGELTPDEAQSIAAVLEIRRKVIETQELEARLAALEQRSQHDGRGRR